MRKIILIVCLLLIAAGCSTAPKPQAKVLERFDSQTVEAGFDTVIVFTAYVDKVATFNTLWNAAKEEFWRYHQMFDKYNSYDGINNLKTVNDNAGIAPVVVDEEMIEMLVLSREWYDKSKGVFDITMGAVLNVWHAYREEGMALNAQGKDGTLPTNEELETANACVGWKYVEIDEAKNTVYLNNTCASLDVGGVAKGFATEKVAVMLEDMGMEAGIVNAGGNVRLIGEKPNGEPWNVGIQDPDGSYDSPSLDSVGYRGVMSMVTSGDYQRYYTVDNVNYHHIINPKTLYPGNDYRAAAIIIKDAGLADIMSKIVFLLPYEEAKAIVEAEGGNAIWVCDKDKAFEAEHTEIVGDYFIAATKGIVSNMRLMK